MENCKTNFLLQITSSEKPTLIENEKIVSSDKNTAQIFNTYFSNQVANLNIPEYYQCAPIAGNIDDSLIKSAVK